jgi:glycosyltransferase involved in cell wall biosynthesis
MKIFLDPSIFNIQKYGGISRYYTEVFSILSQQNNTEVILPVYHADNIYLNESPLQTNNQFLRLLYKVLSFFNISTRSIRKKKGRQLLLQTLQNAHFDVFVPTYYDPYFLKFIQSKPFVLTVYDMIHELFPQYFTDDSMNIVQNKLLLLEKATMVIAVSDNTKKDILAIYPHINETKIKVIYHGSSIRVHDTVSVKLPSDYILFVGARHQYKNFVFLVKSIAAILKNNSALFLVCAGGGVFNDDELNLLKELGIEKQVLYKNFEEAELGQFYQKAKCFVFPSMYEGFGIPVLESMACGCPVVLGHHSSFPEVAGDAGVYFDQTSAEDLQTKIQSLLSDSAVRQEFSKKCLERAKLFNWRHAAEQCFEVYQQAIEKSKLQGVY